MGTKRNRVSVDNDTATSRGSTNINIHDYVCLDEVESTNYNNMRDDILSDAIESYILIDESINTRMHDFNCVDDVESKAQNVTTQIKRKKKRGLTHTVESGVTTRAQKRMKTMAKRSHDGVRVSRCSKQDNLVMSEGAEERTVQLMQLPDDCLRLIFGGVEEKDQRSLMWTCRESRRLMSELCPVISLSPWLVLNSERTSVTVKAEQTICWLSSKGWRVRFVAKRTRLTDMRGLSQAYEIDLSENYREYGDPVVDLAPLCGVSKLNVSGYKNIKGWESLGGVKELDLSYNRQVTSAEPFGAVHTLNLSYTGIEDVSCLGKVDTLNVSSCEVTDVTALGKVRVLDLGSTRVTNVDALTEVQTLRIAGTPVRSVSALANVKHLDAGMSAVEDVSGLHSVETLRLDTMREMRWQERPIVDLSPLIHSRHLRQLSLSSNSWVTDTHLVCLGQIPSLESLDLCGCRNVKDVRPLRKLKVLSLAHCVRVSDVSSLGRLEHLILEGCVCVRDVSALEGVAQLCLGDLALYLPPPVVYSKIGRSASEVSRWITRLKATQ
eukprot:GFYU01028358.1.p1 GENE.GFYU01028358.1~~GFYU01028358.1.p1  ORF type:complete len:551 (-),score=35.44 GFYU01028358.1:153-1805(-)